MQPLKTETQPKAQTLDQTPYIDQNITKSLQFCRGGSKFQFGGSYVKIG